ncbi:hypothetical protein E3N88_08415 [Mikania micrantha]|uniref:Uncharacterized protein n=1 Tax=Mikania micrantha TaxID=192012 RepID=A0A5N6PG57_9ASTR|nr:hypothetical protein E3N88_08415 [Mikania micrantha]
MPKVKTNRVRYPEGWELIEPTLPENDPHDGKRKCEALWPIFKLAHQKSRYIFDLYHRRREISKELYEFCLDQGYADRNIIAKWKKPGYERLCCLRCIQPCDHNFQTTCVCRVPKHLREEKTVRIAHVERAPVADVEDGWMEPDAGEAAREDPSFLTCTACIEGRERPGTEGSSTPSMVEPDSRTELIDATMNMCGLLLAGVP